MELIKKTFEDLMNKMDTGKNKLLLEYYQSVIADIDEMSRILTAKRQEIENKVFELDSSESVIKGIASKKDMGEYSIEWKWADKIEYVLRKYGKPLKLSEIIDEIIELDDLPTSHKARIKNSVGPTLSYMTKKKDTFRKVEGMRYWLL